MMMTMMRMNEHLHEPRGMMPMMAMNNRSSSSSTLPESTTTSSLIERVSSSFERLSVVELQRQPLQSTCTITQKKTAAAVSKRASSSSSSSSSPPSSQYHMADPTDVKRMRAEIKKLLILCLNAQLISSQNHHPNNDTNTTTTTMNKIEKMASLLEQHLFQMAPTLGDYADLRTLEMRLKIALPRVRSAVLRNQKIKAKAAAAAAASRTSSSSSSQSSIDSSKQEQQQLRLLQQLQQSMGGEHRFQETKELVDTIRKERNELVGASCAKCQFIRRQEGKTELVPGAASFGTEFPTAVKRLFFGTPLVTLWDKALRDATTTTKDIATTATTTTTPSWEPLIQQAQANLQEFHEWKAENFVCER